MGEESGNMTFCSAVLRYFFFGFNLLFFLAGLALIAGGGYLQVFYYHYDANWFIDEVSFVLPLLVVLIGFTLSFVSFFGCCGAAKDSCYRLLYAYAVFVGLLFVLEITCGVLSYVYHGEIRERISVALDSLMNDTGNGSAASAFMGEIESDFDCCGASGPENYIELGLKIPAHCCVWPYNRRDECPAEGLINQGCTDALSSIPARFSILVIGIGSFISCVQLIGITCAAVIVRHVRRGPSYQTL